MSQPDEPEIGLAVCGGCKGRFPDYLAPAEAALFCPRCGAQFGYVIGSDGLPIAMIAHGPPDAPDSVP